MATRSGLGAQLGVRAEAAYGTYLAPNKFIPLTSEGLELDKAYIRSKGLRAGHLAQSKDLHIATTRDGNGPIVFEWLNQGMGVFANCLHGNTVTPVQQGVTSAYLQTHAIGLTDPFGKSLTIQVGRPDVAGTVQPFSYIGCKVTEISWTIESGGLVTCNLTVDFRDEDTGQTLGSATYTSGAIPYDFTELAITIAAGAVTNARSLTITCSIPQDTGRYNLGNSGVKDQPIVNDLVAVTAAVTFEFNGLTDHNRFKNSTVQQIIATATGAVIGGGNNFFSKWTLPAPKQVSSGPKVDGPGIITQDVTFEALDDGTNAPLTLDYQSTDTTL